MRSVLRIMEHGVMHQVTNRFPFTSADFASRFLRNGRWQAQVHHPLIVRWRSIHYPPHTAWQLASRTIIPKSGPRSLMTRLDNDDEGGLSTTYAQATHIVKGQSKEPNIRGYADILRMFFVGDAVCTLLPQMYSRWLNHRDWTTCLLP